MPESLDYTVRAFVEMGRFPYLGAWAALTEADQAAVGEAMDLTEVTEFADRPMASLSGGERQRASIAAALAQGGSILLLDEPTSFLDYRHQVQILDLLDRLHRDKGLTVVVVTHDLNSAVASADTVLALKEGRVEWVRSARRSPRRARAGGDLRRGVPTGGGRSPRTAVCASGEERFMSPALRLSLLGAAAVAVVFVLPMVGIQALPFSVLFDPRGTDPAAVIFWQIRVPRVLAAFVGGAGLALGGAVFQAVFRNPLATPYTLGVASGASLGVALASRLGLSLVVFGLSTNVLAAFAGALLAVGVVWALTLVRPGISSTVLLLAGVAMNFFFSSVILFVQYTASLGDSYRIIRWLMGGLGAVDMRTVVHMAPVVLVGALVISWSARELDLLGHRPRDRRQPRGRRRSYPDSPLSCDIGHGRGGGCRLRPDRLCGHDGAPHLSAVGGPESSRSPPGFAAFRGRISRRVRHRRQDRSCPGRAAGWGHYRLPRCTVLPVVAGAKGTRWDESLSDLS